MKYATAILLISVRILLVCDIKNVNFSVSRNKIKFYRKIDIVTLSPLI